MRKATTDHEKLRKEIYALWDKINPAQGIIDGRLYPSIGRVNQSTEAQKTESEAVKVNKKRSHAVPNQAQQKTQQQTNNIANQQRQSWVQRVQNQQSAKAIKPHVRQQVKSTGNATYGKFEGTSRGQAMNVRQSSRWQGYETMANKTIPRSNPVKAQSVPQKQALAKQVTQKHAAPPARKAQPTKGIAR